MLLIAAFCLGMAAEKMKNRYYVCIRRVEEFRAKRDGYLRDATREAELIADLESKRLASGTMLFFGRLPRMERRRGELQANADHYEARRAYYARAAYLPFLAVPEEGYLPGDLNDPPLTPPLAPLMSPGTAAPPPTTYMFPLVPAAPAQTSTTVDPVDE